MVTYVRTFLREFAAFNAKACKGETVRVQDKEGVVLFSAAAPRKSLLGVARGKITFHDDLTQPTLNSDDWKPSL